MSLSDVSIRRPVFAVMLVGGLVLLGAISVGRLGVDLFPRVEFPMVTVATVLRGADPETVEREVSDVLEKEINTIEGIRSLRSTSSEGLSFVMVEFELDQDPAEKAQEVREKVAVARADLPLDVEPPVVERMDPDAAPILAVMVSGPQSIRELTEFADKDLRERLERISGVGSVSLVGGRKREVRIWLDPVKLTGYSLAVDDVIRTLRAEHAEIPGGRIETPEREFGLRTQGKARTVADFGTMIVAQRDGASIRLRDVGTVEDGMEEERTVARLNGERGVSLLLRRQSGTNTVAVAHAVKAELERMRPEFPPGIRVEIAQDVSRFIEASIHAVFEDIILGAALAVIVVFVFLRSLRATLIGAIAIPSSIVATFVFLNAFHITLNVMTLMGLSLCVGMLIDDAIVVIENIYRRMEGGEAAAEAASRGTAEIALAVLATTLSVVAVFVPIAFMKGVIGRYFYEFGLTVVFAVLTSLLVALTVTPMLASRFLRMSEEHGVVYRRLEAGYRSLESSYRRVLEWGLRHRLAVVGLALGAVALGIAVASTIPLDFAPKSDRSEFNVWMQLPLGAPVADSVRAVAKAEKVLRQDPETAYVFSTVGSGVQKRVNEAEIYVRLRPKEERRRSQFELMDQMRARLVKALPELSNLSVEEIPWVSYGGMRPYELMYGLEGPSLERLDQLARGLVTHLKTLPGYEDLRSSYEAGKPEISLVVDRDRAGDLGVPTAQIGSTVYALFGGQKTTTYEEGGERYDVRVQVLPEFRDDPDKLSLVRVRSASGQLTSLSNLVHPRIGLGPVEIMRENRVRQVTVFGNLASGMALGTADREIRAWAASQKLGGDYRLRPVGMAERMAENAQAVSFAFALALAAIYMILASQFNSFVHPFTIMLSAPLSFVGAFVALKLGGVHMEIMTQTSLLMLMGLVMKNGILLVDYTNTLRGRGMARDEAVRTAGPARMRPVLMTTAAMVFGMIPVAMGRGDGGEFERPMGLGTIGGLLTSTLLTLVVVPVVYTLVDDAVGWARQQAAGLQARLAQGRESARAARARPVPPASETSSRTGEPGLGA